MGIVYCLIFCGVVGIICLICFKSEKLNSPEFQAPTIVEVKLLNGGSTVNNRGGIGGAIVGGMVAGPIGAVVGANSSKGSQQLQKFAVKYSNGKVVIKELHPNDWEYKELMKHVKWEDLQ